MLLLIATWLHTAWLSLAFGWAGERLLSRYPKRADAEPTLGLDYLLLFGFLLISALASIVSAFRPIDLYTKLFFAGLGLLFTAAHFRGLSAAVRQALAALRASRPALKALLAAWCFFSIVFGISFIFHNDAGVYHVQSVQWIKEYAVVPGLGNLQGRLAFNSHFFVSSALFSVFWAEDLVVFPLNSLFFFAFGAKLLGDIERGLQRGDRFRVSLSALVLVLFAYHLLDLINITSTDAITSILALYLFFLFLDSPWPAPRRAGLALAWLIMFTAITYKLSTVLLLALAPLTLWPLSRKKAAAFVALGAVVALPFIYRNIILSGYPVYPMPALDVFDFDWEIPREQVVLEKQFIEAWPRIPNSVKETAYARGEEIKPEQTVYALEASFGEWFEPWFNELGTTGKILFIVNLFALLPLALALRRRDYTIAALFGANFLNFLFWFLKAPDPRFAFGFLIFGFALSLAYAAEWPGRDWRLRPAVVFGAIGLLFVLIFWKKRSIIADDGWSVAQLVRPIPYPTTETVEFEAQNFKLRVPVWGDRCFNAPLPCTPYPDARLMMRGEGFRQGFRIAPPAGQD